MKPKDTLARSPDAPEIRTVEHVVAVQSLNPGFPPPSSRSMVRTKLYRVHSSSLGSLSSLEVFVVVRHFLQVLYVCHPRHGHVRSKRSLVLAQR